MIEWWGPVINEFYGSTESSAVSLATSADTLAKPGTVGRAVEGAELRILDDDGRILPAGEVGEIFTRFAELPDFTYHNKPDERAKIDREGFITSGDVGYLDADGYLFLCDRKRDMVISGGVTSIRPRSRPCCTPCPASRTAPCSASPTPSSARS
jgi:long-chain acyl-CoA synthetase